MSGPQPGPPVLGLAEAAKACNVSLSTIRRRRAELLAMGATSDARGWRIPIPALIELGLMDRTTAPTDTLRKPSEAPSAHGMTPVMTPPADSPSDDPSELLEELRSRLAEAEQRAAVAEAVAAERERVISAQAQALRMLEAGPSRSWPVPAADAPDSPSGTPADTTVAPVMTPPTDAPMAPPDAPAGTAQFRERPALRVWPWSRRRP